MYLDAFQVGDGRPPGRRWILGRGLRGGGPGRPPCWRTLKESCKGLGSVSLKINNQHTHARERERERMSERGFDDFSRIYFVCVYFLLVQILAFGALKLKFNFSLLKYDIHRSFSDSLKRR